MTKTATTKTVRTTKSSKTTNISSQKPKITKLSVEKIIFDDIKRDKDFQELLKYAEDIYPKAYNLLPSNPQFKVSFELDGYVELANAIRRVILNEIPIYSLYYYATKDNFITDDKYQLQDFMEKQLELIPIRQELFDDLDEKEISEWSIELRKSNRHLNILDILSGDLVIYDHKDKPIEVNDLCSSSNIILSRLRSMKSLKIKDIDIVKGYGIDNAGAFSSCANIKYKILDQIPLDENAGDENVKNKSLGNSKKPILKGESSLKSDPRKFRIEYTTHRNTKQPLRNLNLALSEMIIRLNKILDEMKNISNEHKQYFSDFIDVETTNEIINIKIKGEYWTLINLICRYCYEITSKNIKFIVPNIEHPEKNIGIIRIIHPEYSTLIQSAIKEIIKDLESLKKDI